jgi:Colicin V production protein
MPHLPAVHTPSLHLSFSVIDFAIVAIFVLQIIWGAKLGFASATFALTGEIIGLILGLLYADTIAKFLDQQFHLNVLVSRIVSDRIQISSNLVNGVSQTISDCLVFLTLFIGIQIAFLGVGRIIHHQVGVRRMKILSNGFFGMFIGVLKASLEVIFFLIFWTAISADSTVSAAIHGSGADHLTQGSTLLPVFMHLIPTSSPLSKFL